MNQTIQAASVGHTCIHQEGGNGAPVCGRVASVDLVEGQPNGVNIVRAYCAEHVLQAALKPALDEYGAALASHRNDWEAAPGTCICGYKWSGKGRSPSRSLGLHVSAAERRAEKVYQVVADLILADISEASRHARGLAS